jgi:hypothetical protein
MPVLLLLVLATVIIAGIVMFAFILREREAQRSEPFLSGPPTFPNFTSRPHCWLAIKSRNLAAVQTALDLHNPKPCSWREGLAGEEQIFIAPPVKGWILVFGPGLPEPSEDVDACFRLACNLSRKFGQVQLFSASRILHHHAWVRADSGSIVRAYCWAGQTLWKQGKRTAAERDLEVTCLDYDDSLALGSFALPDQIAANVEKVPLLAARWSLDPA